MRRGPATSANCPRAQRWTRETPCKAARLLPGKGAASTSPRMSVLYVPPVKSSVSVLNKSLIQVSTRLTRVTQGRCVRGVEPAAPPPLERAGRADELEVRTRTKVGLGREPNPSVRLPAQLSSRPRRPCEAAAHQSRSEEDLLARPGRRGEKSGLCRRGTEGGRSKRESEADDGERAGRVRAVMTLSWGVGGEPLSEDV